MRARMALMHCGAQCILREVCLKAKPAQMLKVSNKGTVPVLVLLADENDSSEDLTDNDGNLNNLRVIDESLDIMQWAMNENPLRNMQNAQAWKISETMSEKEIDALIQETDSEFKDQLDKYKYSDRHPDHPQHHYLEQAMPFLERLENILAKSPYIGGSQFRFVDAAILPFIRQFSMVDQNTFTGLALPNLQEWLAMGLKSDLFASVMEKYPIWQEDSVETPVVFGD